MPTSTRQDAPVFTKIYGAFVSARRICRFTEIFGKFVTSQRADVGIGPYRTLFPESESPHLLFAPVSCKIEQILIAI